MAAGLGIFLVGIKFIGSHLQYMSGGTFKALIGGASRSRTGALIAGGLLGFLTQSAKASSVILAGFVQANLLSVARALPLVFWSNAGAGLIVVASILPIEFVVMFLLGISGLALTFGMPKRLYHVYGVVFGIGMIMYGLSLLESGAAGFLHFPWVEPLMADVHAIYPLVFLIGLVATLVAQADMAVAMIAIAMAASGIFALPEAAMMIFGAQGGAAILTYAFSFNFAGRARQVVIGQVVFKLALTLAMVILFYVEALSGMPLMLAASRAFLDGAAPQAAFVTLLMSFAGGVITTQASGTVLAFVERRFPPSAHEVLAEPEFLNRQAADSPETGLLLVEQEQHALLRRLPLYFDYVRDPACGGHSPAAYHTAFAEVAELCGELLSRISGYSLNAGNSAQLIRLTKLQDQMVNLEGLVFRLTEKLGVPVEGAAAKKLGTAIREGLDFILLAQNDVLTARDTEARETLLRLTDDRGELMDRTRSNYLHAGPELSRGERDFILDITILFENTVQAVASQAPLLAARPMAVA